MPKGFNVFRRDEKSPSGAPILRHEHWTERQLGVSEAPEEWAEARHAYYDRWFGKAEGNTVWHELMPLVPHIDVCVFAPSEELDRSCYTLVTAGMSDLRTSLPEGVDPDLGRAEIIFYVSDPGAKAFSIDQPWFVGAMKYFAQFPFAYQTWLGRGHTVPNGNPPQPVVAGSDLTTALFLPAIFETRECRDGLRLSGEKVNFLWLTFINERETEFKLKHGFDKLAERMNEDTFPQVFDPSRKSMV